MDDNIHKGHRERLRQTAEKTGLNKLPEHQILELLLSYVIPQKDTNPLAHKLINKFGSLAGVFEADKKELAKVEGIGGVTASFLSTCAQIPEVYKNSKIKDKPTIKCPKDSIKYFRDIASIDATEKFYLACLNARCEIIKTENFSNGSNAKIAVDIREIVSIVLAQKATGIIVCHTHPQGEAKPSKEDISFTKKLNTTMCMLGIKLLDHVILSRDNHFSFLNNGLLENEDSTSNIASANLATFVTEYTKDEE